MLGRRGGKGLYEGYFQKGLMILYLSEKESISILVTLTEIVII